MTRVRNPERDKEIVEKYDKLGWTFERIAKHFNLAVSSVHEAYYREIRLSTEGTK